MWPAAGSLPPQGSRSSWLGRWGGGHCLSLAASYREAGGRTGCRAAHVMLSWAITLMNRAPSALLSAALITPTSLYIPSYTIFFLLEFFYRIVQHCISRGWEVDRSQWVQPGVSLWLQHPQVLQSQHPRPGHTPAGPGAPPPQPPPPRPGHPVLPRLLQILSPT